MLLQMGLAAAASGLGQWMEAKFPRSFLSASHGAEASPADQERCTCEEKKCFICLHEEHGDDHGQGDAVHDEHGVDDHAHDGGHGDPAADKHAADGHGAPAAAGHGAADKLVDKEMTSLALTGLSEVAADEHGHEAHGEYHPIVFVKYVDKCCCERAFLPVSCEGRPVCVCLVPLSALFEGSA